MFRWFNIVWFFLLCAGKVLAHAPFDASARMIVHGDSVEVMFTVGPSLADSFFQHAQVAERPVRGSKALTLPAGIAGNFFELSADGKDFEPQSADVLTDGMEFEFHAIYPKPAGQSLVIRPRFLGLLRAPRTSSLVATDDDGNLLGSAIFSPGHEVMEIGSTGKLAVATNSFVIAATNSARETVNAPTNKEVAIVPLVETSVNEAPPHPGLMEFIQLGIEHILTGYDHLLFLIALLLGCRRLKTMLLVVTGFTLTHSLTIALAALNVVTIPSRLVESLIALSIIFVAVENFWDKQRTGFRYVVTCGFGLVHGFGFASALRETGLIAGSGLAMPLFGFNLGVEIGQLAVVLVVLPLLFLLRKNGAFRSYGACCLSALIVVAGVYFLWKQTNFGH